MKRMIVAAALSLPSLAPPGAMDMRGVPPTGLYQETVSLEPEKAPREYIPDRERLSPNYRKGRDGQKVDLIVIHTTEGSGAGAEEWLANPVSEVSCHYLVLEDGKAVRMVREEDTAWHARGYNPRSIGIEFAGYHDKRLSDVQIRGGEEILEYLLKKYSLQEEAIKPHSELDPGRRRDPGEENLKLLLEAVDVEQPAQAPERGKQ